jgi:DNA-binding CsgD family transcriptional regulator
MSLIETILNLAHSDLENIDIDNVQGLPCHSYIKDKNGNYLSCSDEQAIAVGLAGKEELIGLNDFDVLAKPQALGFKENDDKVIYAGKPLIVTEKFTLYDGTKMIATSIKTPLRTRLKKIIGIAGLSILQEDHSIITTIENPYSLTKRQLQCLYYVVKGFSQKEIACSLNISDRTVEHYMEAVKIKLDCYKRSDLIGKALMIPWIKNQL